MSNHPQEGDPGFYSGPLTASELAMLARPITLPDVVLLDAIQAAEPAPCPHCDCRDVVIEPGEPADPECGIMHASGETTLCRDCGAVLHEAEPDDDDPYHADNDPAWGKRGTP